MKMLRCNVKSVEILRWYQKRLFTSVLLPQSLLVYISIRCQ